MVRMHEQSAATSLRLGNDLLWATALSTSPRPCKVFIFSANYYPLISASFIITGSFMAQRRTPSIQFGGIDY